MKIIPETMCNIFGEIIREKDSPTSTPIPLTKAKPESTPRSTTNGS